MKSLEVGGDRLYFLIECVHHPVDQSKHEVVDLQLVGITRLCQLQNNMMQMVEVGCAFQKQRVDVIVPEKPRNVVVLLQCVVELGLEIKYRTNVRLFVDVPCHVFGAGLRNKNAPNVNFQVIAKDLEFKITGSHETQVERPRIFDLRLMALYAVAFKIANLIKR